MAEAASKIKSNSKLETRNSKPETLMSNEIKCARCGQKRPALGFAPLPTELGQKVAAEVCQPCWSEWLQTQTRIINHYGLDLTNPEAQGFLLDNMKAFFYGQNELSQIDTSKEGTIKW
jgi:Fe-S cluster biosynthesis and repair protein YggX